MTHAAIVFAVSDVQTGRLLGQAVVCTVARYASILPMAADRLARCHAPAATWKNVEAELALGLPATPLDKSSMVAELLLSPVNRSSAVVQYVTAVPVESEPVLTLAKRLDLLCRAFPGPQC